VSLCGITVLGFIGAIAAQKPEANAIKPASEAKPWFDARLRAFFAAKAAQAHQLADQAKGPVA
jgi:hypothetical protein